MAKTTKITNHFLRKKKHFSAQRSPLQKFINKKK